MQVYSLNVNLRRMMSQLQKCLQETWILAEKLTLEIPGRTGVPLLQLSSNFQRQRAVEGIQRRQNNITSIARIDDC